MRPFKGVFVFIIFVLFNLPAYSAGTTESLAQATCPSAGIWDGMIDKVCWSAVFPIYWVGIDIGSGDKPDGANTDPVCVCYQTVGGIDIPSIGMSVGFYQPARLISNVRAPYCMPAFGGESWGDGLSFGGMLEQEGGKADINFYNNHYYSFPLMQMLEVLLESKCSPDGYTQFDLMYMTEYDPTWNDDELSLYLAPETVIFANPLAIASCSYDGLTVTATGQPNDSMFYCAGFWGHLYPLSGTTVINDSPPRETSLLTTRSIALMHRKGLARRTYGNDAMCGGVLHPFIIKSQYKLQQYYPIPESDGSLSGFNALQNVYGSGGSSSGGHNISGCSHPIGASTFAWGEWRNIPAVGEDYTNVIFRYTDCCLR